MILLDTHVWVWWIHGDPRLTNRQKEIIKMNEVVAIGVSVVSCWEVAKLVEHRRLSLPCGTAEWFQQALAYPGVVLLGLTPAIALESTQLPSGFHRDPADQMIVATARVYQCGLLTSDSRILQYPHVRCLS